MTKPCSYCGTYRHKFGCPTFTSALFVCMGVSAFVAVIGGLIASLTHSVTLHFPGLAILVLALTIATLVSVLKRPH